VSKLHGLLEELIAKEEGFGIPGSKPTRYNNPGDLRHSPHSSHTAASPNDIGQIDTEEHGWEDLTRQLEIFAERGLTLRQLVEIYAPPNENNTERYLAFLCKGLGLDDDCTVADALTLSE
jgi:hypothetical protein